MDAKLKARTHEKILLKERISPVPRLSWRQRLEAENGSFSRDVGYSRCSQPESAEAPN
jgi:hypothetical protein